MFYGSMVRTCIQTWLATEPKRFKPLYWIILPLREFYIPTLM